jgi:hypothetical protein
VAAGRGDTQRLHRDGVAADVAQVERRGRVLVGGGLLVARLRGGDGLPVEHPHDLRQRLQAGHVHPVDEPGFPRALARDDEPAHPLLPRGLRDRERAPATAQPAAERELTEDDDLGERVLRDLAARREHGERDRQVEARAALAQVGGREVGDDAPHRELEAAVEQRGADTLAGLADGGVAEPDDAEGRQPLAHVDLDGHGTGVEAVDGEGVDTGEHEGDRRRRSVTAQGQFATTS